MQYAVRLTAATRAPKESAVGDISQYLSCGASPRASIHLIESARALACLRGRDYVVRDDVVYVAPDVLRHRLVISYEAQAENVTADDLIARLLEMIPMPKNVLNSRVSSVIRS